MLGLLTGLGLALSLNFFYYISLLGAFLFVLYQQWLIHAREPSRCIKAFLNNQWIGAILFMGVYFGVVNTI